MTYDEARFQNPIVRNYADGHFTAEQALALLASQAESYYRTIMNAEAITPKVYEIDGKLIRWDAPTELLEITKLTP